MDVFVHGQRHDQSLVVVGVVPQQFQPAGRANHMHGRIAEVPFENVINVSHGDVKREPGAFRSGVAGQWSDQILGWS